MNLQVGLFFGVKDLEGFCKNELFKMTNCTKSHLSFKHEKISKNEMKSLPLDIIPGLIHYEGYTYYQKDSIIVFINNVSDNWVVNIEQTAKRTGYIGLYMRIAENVKYPAYMLDYFKGDEKRTIYSIKDISRWIFYNSGIPQDFENGDTYSERGATKKFNYKKLKLFCRNIGFDIENPDFLSPVGEIIHTRAIEG